MSITNNHLPSFLSRFLMISSLGVILAFIIAWKGLILDLNIDRDEGASFETALKNQIKEKLLLSPAEVQQDPIGYFEAYSIPLTLGSLINFQWDRVCIFTFDVNDYSDFNLVKFMKGMGVEFSSLWEEIKWRLFFDDRTTAIVFIRGNTVTKVYNNISHGIDIRDQYHLFHPVFKNKPYSCSQSDAVYVDVVKYFPKRVRHSGKPDSGTQLVKNGYFEVTTERPTIRIFEKEGN